MTELWLPEIEPDKYLGKCGREYIPPKEGHAFCVFEVLPFLKGHSWDEIALACVHSLRPSRIRVTSGAVTCDACPWRVTVFMDANNQIERIEQEVEVGCVEKDGIHCGHDMELYLDKFTGVE